MPRSSRDRTPLPLVVLGCDFRVASTQWRGRMLLTKPQRLELHATLGRLDPEPGLVSLITCNRSEWIVSAREPEWIGELLLAHIHYLWEDLTREHGYTPRPYLFTGQEAARHVLSVVAGLESFVMGEQQIGRQFRLAVRAAREEGTANKILNGLDKAAGYLGKRLHEKRLLQRSSVGIHSVAGRFIENHFGPAATGRDAAKKPSIAVVGMGEIGRKIAGLLEQSGIWNVIRVNRTLRSPGWVPLENLDELLPGLDGLLIATGADRPMLSLARLCEHKQKRRRLWVVDIGVPEQVARDRKPPCGVELVNLDRLVQESTEEMDPAWLLRMNQEVSAAVADFETFCCERGMVGFLDSAQALHQEYIRTLIPAFVAENFAELTPAERKKLLMRTRRLLIGYSSRLIEKFHASMAKGER